ncbi:hypothetical protein LO772_03085 [Yinghuangia sp. ASG 101]|uniref:hypothetical protein n=1 Tax=Yinghuangia sp. ASG 101 TaxID=2896848 RepID=UPI001E65312F|nr:hypothetical protein [Yinghuangia sp. ASG 101]UGQ12617.1 hypothetical protein LO772_03085 [Yinghuangia sp. ASG 101]
MTSFLDKAKEKARDTVTTGKQKADEFQANRAQADLFKQLGAAYYAEQRRGAPHDEVSRLVGLLDEHERAHGPSTGDQSSEGPGPVGLA